MKKVFASILALSLVLCGCSQASDNTEPVTEPATDPSTETTVEMVTISLQTGFKLTLDNNGTVTEQICTWIYDENNHLTTVELADGSGEILTTCTVVCNENGDIIKESQTMNGQEMTLENTVDELGNILTSILTLDGEVQQITTNTYNEAGQNITTVIEFPADGSTNTTTNSFDADRLVKQITTDSNGQIIDEMNYAYSEDGLTVTITNNNMTTVRTLDEAGNILTQTTQMPGMTQKAEYSYKTIEVPADDPLAK